VIDFAATRRSLTLGMRESVFRSDLPALSTASHQYQPQSLRRPTWLLCADCRSALSRARECPVRSTGPATQLGPADSRSWPERGARSSVATRSGEHCGPRLARGAGWASGGALRLPLKRVSLAGMPRHLPFRLGCQPRLLRSLEAEGAEGVGVGQLSDRERRTAPRRLLPGPRDPDRPDSLSGWPTLAPRRRPRPYGPARPRAKRRFLQPGRLPRDHRDASSSTRSSHGDEARCAARSRATPAAPAVGQRPPCFCSPPTAATPAGSVRWPLLVQSGTLGARRTGQRDDCSGTAGTL
jgi:hypothetical protein